MITHQTPEDILKAATPAQKIVWNEIFLQYGKMIAITQMYYCGAMAGHELLTYSANKMYFSLLLGVNASGPVLGIPAILTFYNRLNAGMFSIGDNTVAYNSTTVTMQYVGNSIQLENILFSRVTVAGYGTIQYVGYRINF